jgi:hypothetical protein
LPFYQPLPQFPQNNYYDLYDLMKNYMGDDKNVDERGYNILPVNKISVPVDEKTVRQNGTVNCRQCCIFHAVPDTQDNFIQK